MNKYVSTKRLWIIALSICFLILLIPTDVTCGSPHATCAAPPKNSGGKAQYYFEIQPLGITIIESIIWSNTPIYYSSGTR